jgi:hypothetical protein
MYSISSKWISKPPKTDEKHIIQPHHPTHPAYTMPTNVEVKRGDSDA